MQPSPVNCCHTWRMNDLIGLDDAGLVRLIRCGRIELFAELVRRHQGLVVGLVRQVAGDESEVEDLAQEVFLKAYKGLAKFRGEAKFSTWLGSIAYRVAADHLKRKTGLEISLPPEDLRAVEGGEFHGVPDPPDRRVNRESEGEWVRGMVRRLSPSYRLVLSLFYLSGKSINQVSAMTGMPPGTVKANLNRARIALRRMMERERARRGGDIL